MLASFLKSYIFETNVTIYQGMRYCHNNTLRYKTNEPE